MSYWFVYISQILFRTSFIHPNFINKEKENIDSAADFCTDDIVYEIYCWKA